MKPVKETIRKHPYIKGFSIHELVLSYRLPFCFGIPKAWGFRGKINGEEIPLTIIFYDEFPNPNFRSLIRGEI